MNQVLLAPRHNERTAAFWRLVAEDLEWAPYGVRRLVEENGPLWMSVDEARDVFAWCEERPGWVPFKRDLVAMTGKERPIAVAEQISGGGRSSR